MLITFLPEQPLATVKKRKVIPKHYRLSTAQFRPQNEKEKNFKKKEITEAWPSYRAIYYLQYFQKESSSVWKRLPTLQLHQVCFICYFVTPLLQDTFLVLLPSSPTAECSSAIVFYLNGACSVGNANVLEQHRIFYSVPNKIE